MEKIIVLSGANLFGGGTLSIFKDCISYANDALSKEYIIFALVFDKSNFYQYQNVSFIEFKSIRKSYFHRIYYEYYYYHTYFKNKEIYLWFSINDISSYVIANRKAVYCQNAIPFRKLTLTDLFDQPKLFLFSLLYKELYRINIQKNNYVVVQQSWMRDYFNQAFKVDKSKIIVASPNIKESSKVDIQPKPSNENKVFFFPTYPRPFKNIEVILKAAEILETLDYNNFTTVITINGTENHYANRLVKKYKFLKCVNFIGLIDRQEVYQYYNLADCLIFPSKLESWGLPITEFKQFNKPMLVANLPYAKETVGDYNKACFFNPDDDKQLANLMGKVIRQEVIDFETTKRVAYKYPYSKDWEGLFKILLN